MMRRDFQEIDLSAVENGNELHESLYEALGFPEYYGRNWSAFWDCICTVEMPRRLRVRGWLHLERRLPRDAQIMKQCLADLNRQHPDLATEVEWA